MNARLQKYSPDASQAVLEVPVCVGEGLTKKDSAILKGWAIVIMVLHHVLGFPDRWPIGANVVSFLPFSVGGYPIEVVVGKAGGVCVSIFLFVSGYGLMASTSHVPTFKSALARVVAFMQCYWLVVVVFVPAIIVASNAGLISGGSAFSIFYGAEPRFVFDTFDATLTLFGFSSRYNAEWWFVGLYLGLLFLWPVIYILLRKGALGFIIILVGIFSIGRFGDALSFPAVSAIGVWAYPFVVGAICAGSNWFRNNQGNPNFIWQFFGLAVFFAYPFFRMVIAKPSIALGIPLPILDSAYLVFSCKSASLLPTYFRGGGRLSIWVIGPYGFG